LGHFLVLTIEEDNEGYRQAKEPVDHSVAIYICGPPVWSCDCGLWAVASNEEINNV
jgi:hypothetical protein